jgi:hypothetical protein
MIKNLIQKFNSKEQKFCFEKHNMLHWYFTVEHPCPPVSVNEENPFFVKYGFIILRDVENICTDHKELLKFLLFTTDSIKNSKIIFGKEKVYFKDRPMFIQLEDKDIFIFDPQRVNLSINKNKVKDILP